jgi:imidazolonepropionase-like amidohydrolase
LKQFERMGAFRYFSSDGDLRVRGLRLSTDVMYERSTALIRLWHMLFRSIASLTCAAALLMAGCVQEGLLVERHDRLALVGANVVDVDAGEVHTGYTVMVEDGVIRWVGPDGGREIPPGTRVVDAAGGYLIPGLADLHIHHFPRQEIDRRSRRPYDERDLMLYVVNGVTLVRVMDGSPRDLDAQVRIERGELLGPRFVVCAPMITNRWNARPPAELADTVRAYHGEGYDCLKVYSGLDEERFLRVMALGDSLGLHTTGHAQGRLSFEHTLRYASIEHIEELQQFFGRAPFTDDEHAVLIDEIVESGAFVTPSIGGFYHYRYLDDRQYATLLARESSRYVSLFWIQERDRMIADWQNRGADMDSLSRAWKDLYENALPITGLLHARGVPLLLGTDTGDLLHAPGFAVHEELEALVRAGLSPAAALRTGTSAPADFLGIASGRIEPGRRADLVLLAADPLADISNVRQIRGVLVGDAWLDDDARQAILRALRRR